MTHPLDRPGDPTLTPTMVSPPPSTLTFAPSSMRSPSSGGPDDVATLSIRELIAALAATEQTLMRARSTPAVVSGQRTDDGDERTRVIAEQARLVRELRLRRRSLPPVGHPHARRR